MCGLTYVSFVCDKTTKCDQLIVRPTSRDSRHKPGPLFDTEK